MWKLAVAAEQVGQRGRLRVGESCLRRARLSMGGRRVSLGLMSTCPESIQETDRSLRRFSALEVGQRVLPRPQVESQQLAVQRDLPLPALVLQMRRTGWMPEQ